MIHINIGSNLNSKNGSKFENISIATKLLINFGLNIKKISSFYETPSYPNNSLPRFINIGLIGEYKFGCTKLLKNISLIEKRLGRMKSKKNDPRICDIDIIDYNGEIIHRKLRNHKLNTPHKRMHNRNFVLFPLYELDKDWVHPKLNKNIVFLMSNLTSEQLLSIKIAE